MLVLQTTLMLPQKSKNANINPSCKSARHRSLTQADQNLQEPSSAELSELSLESEGQPAILADSTGHEFMLAQTHLHICSLPSYKAQPKALRDLSALKHLQDPQATLCTV